MHNQDSRSCNKGSLARNWNLFRLSHRLGTPHYEPAELMYRPCFLTGAARIRVVGGSQ